MRQPDQGRIRFARVVQKLGAGGIEHKAGLGNPVPVAVELHPGGGSPGISGQHKEDSGVDRQAVLVPGPGVLGEGQLRERESTGLTLAR